MIKKALFLLTSTACAALAAVMVCSVPMSTATSAAVVSAVQSADTNAPGSIIKQNKINIKDNQDAAELAAAVTAAVAAPAEPKTESLWESELFDASRFTLNISLNQAERREAQKLARNFEAYMEKGSLIMHYLLTELKEQGLPNELAALPLVESGFDPRAKSHAGAVGPWQFIRSTGKTMGLSRSSNYDEFYDFVASTEASLKYLKALYEECGHNWELAVVGYNQGGNRINRAIRAAKANGVREFNPKTIRLTASGKAYLKRFRAYADILRHPDKYGVEHPEVENRPAFKRVQIAGRVSSMQTAAKLSGVKLETLRHLNAGYLSDSLKSPRDHGLLIPIDNVGQFEAALARRNTSGSKSAN